MNILDEKQQQKWPGTSAHGGKNSNLMKMNISFILFVSFRINQWSVLEPVW